MTNKKIIGVDLFSGAGGLSLGASMAGIDVKLAIEKDPYAAETYKHNHPHTNLLIDDIRNISQIDVEKNSATLLFGGPPCQGFSISNQRTRNKNNPSNWLFKEFIRIAEGWMPDWVVFENVRGIVETEKGYFQRVVGQAFENLGYTCSWKILDASNFGVPQIRSRFFLVASKHGIALDIPDKSCDTVTTVAQAIDDLPALENGSNKGFMNYKCVPKSDYSKMLRGTLTGCTGHSVTRNSDLVLERYNYIPPGGNWQNIPENLMMNYTDRNRCHTGIYHRLNSDKPAITIGNYRKAMLIHPRENRGLSVREAARIQSFPDSYEFKGSIGYQQQQVGNAVPPLLAKAVFDVIVDGEK